MLAIRLPADIEERLASLASLARAIEFDPDDQPSTSTGTRGASAHISS